MKETLSERLVQFLRSELLVSETSIQTAMQRNQQDISLLPVCLWQAGDLTVQQLDQVFDWILAARGLQTQQAS